MLLDEAYILNEKFSMDNWTKKDFDKIIELILQEDNTNLEANAGDCWEVQQLNLPDEVKELILQDYITKQLPKEDAYMSTYRAQFAPKPEDYVFEDLDAWYVIDHPYARKYLEKYLLKEFKETYYWIESKGNPLTLYRFIHFDYNRWKLRNKPQTKLSPEEMGDHILKNSNIHLGICWTTNLEKAKEFGYEEHEIDDYCMIIQAKVNRDAINLPNTLAKRSELTYYHYEDEIELIKGSPITVEKVYFPPSKSEELYGVKFGRKGDWIEKPINKQYKV